MQEKIHPNFHEDATVSCACGETFKTGSVMETIKVEICSKCHPFFTGKVKMLDTAGRVEKFQKKHANAELGVNTKPQKRVVKPVVAPKDRKAAAAKAETKPAPKAEAKAKPAEAKK
ncbi:MAG: 50S ribosomal protein L31 [bacterium ADurb.Bin243]|mgnify:FL=1|nr:MAG: 50S ribosomal protein L31 [bacterium ADurb.Bin243]